MGPPPAGLQQLQDLIARFINLAVGIAFIAVLVMLLVGGYKFLTSGGEAKAVASARDTFTWALVGVLFLVIAWLILQLIAKLTGVDVTHFCLGFPGAETGCN